MSKLYIPIHVMRPDAGDTLWAVGSIVNNGFVEFGETPSHDKEAIQRRCDQLNALRANADQRRKFMALAVAFVLQVEEIDKATVANHAVAPDWWLAMKRAQDAVQSAGRLANPQFSENLAALRKNSR